VNYLIDWTKFEDGVAATERVDEVTLLVVPEAISSQVNPSQRSTLHSDMLGLCNKLKDRFAIMDVVVDPPQTIFQDAAAFRDNEVGNNNLKYGAAYYPALNTLLTRFYNDSDVAITGGTFNGDTLADVLSGIASSGTITITGGTGGTELIDGDNVQIGPSIIFTAKNTPTINSLVEFKIETSGPSVVANTTAGHLINLINNHPSVSLIVTASLGTASAGSAIINVKAKISGTAGNSIVLEDPAADDQGLVATSTNPGFLDGGINADKTLYNNITAQLQANYTMQLYPSSTMAGIYASVDRDRGVWKAPANVSINGVVAPSVNISAQDQENLNVDAGSGKSINAIRAFAGKGILVWGARTLAGNDNEWRYINVRRLFIMAEESIQKASEFVVFEPNDGNTWTRVRGLITNFLTNLWRDGALAGATPKDAFFVKVGLGETMTAQDILEGKLIIQVGLAAVRPAEFIILQFSHKLQES
jgi:hypothetical protein